MKKLYLIIAALVCLNATLFASGWEDDFDFWEEDYMLADFEATCHSGGSGSSQCSIEKNTNLGADGISQGCSVTCGGGFYACCGIRCTCIPISEIIVKPSN